MLSEIRGIGAATEKKLNELGIYDCKDLIERMPVSYMDMSVIALPQESGEGDFCLFSAIVSSTSKPFKKGRLEIFKATAICENVKIKLVWFNRNYTAKILKIGTKYRVYGRLKIEQNTKVFYNPSFEEYDTKNSLCGIKPIYWTKGVIAQKNYRNYVSEALKLCMPESIIPYEEEKKLNMMSLSEAYKRIHFPIDSREQKAKERVVLEKITRRICAFRIAQSKQICEKKRRYSKNIDFSPLWEVMPFHLNESQQTALEKLINVFVSDKKLNSVLCGDVGSGKTAVAVSAAYFAVKNGYKVAIMAPTEILAKQHYNFINSIFPSLGISVCFLSGSAKIKERDDLRFKIKNGFFDVIIGTHSLLYIGEEIPDLGFVVVDEQHRFGVAQRTSLISKGETVDVLTLSATPIPRSMQLVAYGEVEYLTIKSRFESTVKTVIVPSKKREDMWEYIAVECEKGTQAYIVAPKIFDEDGAESESVERLADELKKYLPGEKTGVLHGKIKAQDKQSVLDAFYRNEISVIVSTTVVEVGIDVPNASIMVVMDAERFGLATLHQLRGRVGRKGQPSFCFLFTSKEPTEGLKMLCECSDGFKLAEKDFELRGGGDIFGLEQSGTGTITGLNLKNLNRAKEIADKIPLKKVETLLTSEIKSFSLCDVSLT